MIRVTVEEAQKNFDFLMTLVERGETILIEGEKGNVVMAPVASTNNTINDQIEEALLEREKQAQYGGPAPIPGTNLPSAAELASFVAQETASAHKDLK